MTIIQIVGCKDIYFLIFNYLDAVIRNFFSYMRIKVIIHIYNMYNYSITGWTKNEIVLQHVRNTNVKI